MQNAKHHRQNFRSIALHRPVTNVEKLDVSLTVYHELAIY